MTRKEILEAAERCVCQDRQDQYGNPEDNFAMIAAMWNIYLGVTGIDAKDVSMMMSLLKIARAKNGSGHVDNYVDLAGYAACGGELQARVDEEAAKRQMELEANAIRDALAKEASSAPRHAAYMPDMELR